MSENKSIQKTPEKRKQLLPPDALEKGDRHLMKCLFGEEIMAEVDKIVAKNNEGVDESFMV